MTNSCQTLCRENRCSSKKSKNSLQENSSGSRLLSFQFRYSIESIKNDWTSAAPEHDVFLSATYLKELEKNPPDGMEFAYLVFYEGKVPIGIAYCQFYHFKASDSLKLETSGSGWWQRSLAPIRNLLVQKLQFEILYVGNLLATGEHGFHFKPAGTLDSEKKMDFLLQGLQSVVQDRKKQGKQPAVWVLKDLEEKNRLEKTVLPGFKEFTIQPAMRFYRQPHWKTFDDYLQALHSRYRIRVRRARKKIGSIKHHGLSLEYIKQHRDILEGLYKGVIEDSDFFLFKLNFDYLIKLKATFGEAFQVTGYFLDGELVGFFNLFENHRELDAHFIGFKKELNGSHQLYLNMLLDMVEQGINKGADSIHFARTALEIKSSVGAIPENLYIYARHRLLLPHFLMRALVNWLNPTRDWVPRQALKASEVQA